MKLKHTSSIFEVTIDDKLCFSTNKVCIHRVALRPCRGQIYRTNLSRPRCPLETPSASQQPLPKIQNSFRVLVHPPSPADPGSQGGFSSQSQSVPDQPAQPLSFLARRRNERLGCAQIADLSGRVQLTGKATNTILQELKNQAQRYGEQLQSSPKSGPRTANSRFRR